MPTTLHTAADLGAEIRDRRYDAVSQGVRVTNDWCRDQMHDLGVTRYEDVTDEILDAIAERVDSIDGPVRVIVDGQSVDFGGAVALMDADLREQLDTQFGGSATPQAFVDAYIAAHREAFGEDWTVN